MFIVKPEFPSASAAPYDAIGSEYYDPRKHPTCDVFGKASSGLIEDSLEDFDFNPGSALCDLGAGRSTLGSYAVRRRPAFASIHIIDQSETMLAWSEACAPDTAEFYLLDAEELSTLDRKFDLITASLGDPFNTEKLWRAVEASLAPGGQCLFTTPSYHWAATFRGHAAGEVQDAALFELSNGTKHYVPSYVYPEDEQLALIVRAGLSVVEVRHATLADLPSCPPKVAHLSAGTPVVTLFRVTRN